MPPVAGPLVDWAGLVGVAQLVELRVVVPAVAGSSPVAHPGSGCKISYLGAIISRSPGSHGPICGAAGLTGAGSARRVASDHRPATADMPTATARISLRDRVGSCLDPLDDLGVVGCASRHALDERNVNIGIGADESTSIGFFSNRPVRMNAVRSLPSGAGGEAARRSDAGVVAKARLRASALRGVGS